MSGHVSMMNDVLITQMSLGLLRSTLRTIISQEPAARTILAQHVRKHYKTQPLQMPTSNELFPKDGSVESLSLYLSGIRCMFSCHMVEESLVHLTHLIRAILEASTSWEEGSKLESILVYSSADVVQAIQAIKESQNRSSSLRANLLDLQKALHQCNTYCDRQGLSVPYARAQVQASDAIGLLYPSVELNGSAQPPAAAAPFAVDFTPQQVLAKRVDRIRLGDKLEVPRMFNGLWQMSSPAWGSASAKSVDAALLDLLKNGLVAADMADHYGDAELVYGSFRNRLPSDLSPLSIAATKWCVFAPLDGPCTEELVLAAVEERCRRLDGKVELLQFHWQDYSNKDYLVVIKLLVALTQTRPDLVTAIGLCNFDARTTKEVCEYMVRETGSVGIVSNQVQYSLIDSRPLFGMAEVCETFGIKLLTYGSFCGGFLSNRWLNHSPPDAYGDVKPLTPSQRKYLDMIYTWGTWAEFTALLSVLNSIAQRHSVDVSNVATRWVLQRPETAAVIVGTRLGVSSNLKANLNVFAFELDGKDIAEIEEVALGPGRSKALALFKTVGDCGQEYR